MSKQQISLQTQNQIKTNVLQTNENNIVIEKNISYGIQIPTKQQLKQIKKKVQLLKQAIVKQRSQRQSLQNQLKDLNQQYMLTQQTLQRKQQKNQILLHQSRQLKDILIREKQQIKNIQDDIQMMKDKKKKMQNGNSNNGGNTSTNNTTNSNNKDWKSFLTGFWK